MIMLKENLLSIMEERGISRRALSLNAGLSEAIVKKIVSGLIPHPRIDTVVKIAAALNVGVERLLFNSPGAIKNCEISEDILTKSIIKVEEIISEKNLLMNAKERAHAYIRLHQIYLLKDSEIGKENNDIIMKLIK